MESFCRREDEQSECGECQGAERETS
jgi:hypothetical protein